jgi:hypothetical protein
MTAKDMHFVTRFLAVLPFLVTDATLKLHSENAALRPAAR